MDIDDGMVVGVWRSWICVVFHGRRSKTIKEESTIWYLKITVCKKIVNWRIKSRMNLNELMHYKRGDYKCDSWIIK